MTPALAHEKFYTIDDIYSLPEGSRAELIDRQPETTRKYYHFYMLPFTTTSPKIRAIVKYTPPPLPSFYLQMIPNIWSRTYL